MFLSPWANGGRGEIILCKRTHIEVKLTLTAACSITVCDKNYNTCACKENEGTEKIVQDEMLAQGFEPKTSHQCAILIFLTLISPFSPSWLLNCE